MVGAVFFVILCFAPAVLAEYAWNVDIPIPAYDPLWQKFANMWENHWDGKNIDDMISVLHELEKKYGDRIDTYLWLGKCHYIKGLHNLKSRDKYNKIAEAYAVKAYQIDNHSVHVFFVLLNSLSSCDDIAYIRSRYGGWIKSMAPLPNGQLLPDMPPSKEWDDLMIHWKQKNDFNNLSTAVLKLEEIAKNRPDDALAQLWACLAYYNLGDYYLQMGLHKEKGVFNYNKALVIEPHNMEAHFWYQLALSRKIQVASILTKAVHLKRLMNHLIFCIQENALYNSGGPVYVVATMIVEGGWVCEKGIAAVGYTVDMVITFLQILEILYPENLYIPYITGVLLEREKRDKDARLVLEKILKKGPPSANDSDYRHNLFTYNATKELYEKLLAR